MNPTVDNLFAAMGWHRDAYSVEDPYHGATRYGAFRTAEEMAEVLAGTVTYRPSRADARKLWPREYLAPRWQVPAIRRRQAARRTA